MSRPLDPEIKAIRAVDRALKPLDLPAQIRLLEFMCARALNLPGFDIESGRKNARLSEALRWIRKEQYVDQSVRRLIDRALEESGDG